MRASISDTDLAARLEEGIRALGQDPDQHPCEQYLAFVALLGKWNRAYNLSGIRDPERIITHHILDSLAVRPFVVGERCLDVGSGAGLPGFILALSLPETRWVLLDSSRKKTRFLTQAVLELKPGNIEVVTARAEAYRPQALFTTITSRAVTSLQEFRAMTAHLLAPGGRLLALKGGDLDVELAGAGAAEVHALHVPGVPEQRRLVVMQ
jgi:16S rRNA (guanine527-N7)-methyltransferase